MRHFTRKEVVPCLCKTFCGMATLVSLFFLNVLLIMGYSHILVVPCCNQTSVVHLVGWSTALSLVELGILLIMLAVATFIINCCREAHIEYKLAMVEEMPRVPSMEEFNIDAHLSEDETDSL